MVSRRKPARRTTASKAKKKASRRKPEKATAGKTRKKTGLTKGGGYPGRAAHEISLKCTQPVAPERTFDADVNNDRQSLIRTTGKKWVNGTKLHYYFFTNAAWRGTAAEKQVVKDAFSAWKGIPIGLEFEEVDSADEAEVRIGFLRGDGAWSYVGRDVLNQGQSARTMNFGWNIASDIDTAIHEIGHTLGFPHEHQNPNSGIVWDEQAVIDSLAGPPNFWSEEKTRWNILRKLPDNEVDGSQWDKDSIMHYPFEAGLIKVPEIYRNQALIPAPGLSSDDKLWARKFYPGLSESDHRLLKPFEAVRVTVEPGDQLNFLVKPTATRRYTFQTFGLSDTVMVLFEDINGDLRYRSGDDDSGTSRNARIRIKLYAGQTYVLRVRLYWAHRSGDFAVMMW